MMAKILVFLTAGALCAVAQTVAAFQTSIVDTSGKPIPQARVSYTRIPRVTQTASGQYRRAAGEVQLSSFVSPQADGAVSAADLPPGEYLISVDAPGYLTVGEWSAPISVTLMAGRSSQLGAIRLTKGATVQITVNDMQHLLPPDNPLTAPLIVGVLDDDGTFHRARLASATSNSRVLTATVPYGRRMSLWLHSWTVNVADGNGIPLSNRGANTNFLIQPGGMSPAFVVNVTGPAE